MNTSYDIVMRENDFVLYQNNKPVLTVNGNETAHSNARLLRMAITSEIAGKKQGLQPVELLQRVADSLAGVVQALQFDVEQALVADPLLNKNSGLQAGSMAEILHQKPQLLDFVFLNSSSLVSAVGAFFTRKLPGTVTETYLTDSINELSLEHKVVLDALHAHHGLGILVHLLLIKGFLSVSEYVAAIIVLEMKTEVNDELPYDEANFIDKRSMALAHNALVATDFLTLCKDANKLTVIEEIVHRGEDGQTEFKSTLRWDLRQQKKSPDIEHASLKTICALLNSEGGDLLIGVRDDGSIEGIETDQFGNDDRFLLHLWTLIKTTMGHEVIEWVKTSLQVFGDRTVCRVNCKKATKPVFLNHKNNESFYVRVGPASNSLEIRAALKYIEEHY
jgi:hypothetical protein